MVCSGPLRLYTGARGLMCVGTLYFLCAIVFSPTPSALAHPYTYAGIITIIIVRT